MQAVDGKQNIKFPSLQIIKLENINFLLLKRWNFDQISPDEGIKFTKFSYFFSFLVSLRVRPRFKIQGRAHTHQLETLVTLGSTSTTDWFFYLDDFAILRQAILCTTVYVPHVHCFYCNEFWNFSDDLNRTGSMIEPIKRNRTWSNVWNLIAILIAFNLFIWLADTREERPRRTTSPRKNILPACSLSNYLNRTQSNLNRINRTQSNFNRIRKLG